MSGDSEEEPGHSLSPQGLSPRQFLLSDSDDEGVGEGDRKLLAKYFTSRDKGAPAEVIFTDLADTLAYKSGIPNVCSSSSPHVSPPPNLLTPCSPPNSML